MASVVKKAAAIASMGAAAALPGILVISSIFPLFYYILIKGIGTPDYNSAKVVWFDRPWLEESLAIFIFF
jgi:hypothetical protein